MTRKVHPSTERVDLLILESHPVQYHAPVYRELARLRPGQVHVAYATDCSVQGHQDTEFGRHIAWDVPLLEGYDYTVLKAEHGKPLHGARSLHGRGIPALLRKFRPRAVMFTQLGYEFEWVAYALCVLWGIPIWLRMETQDKATKRSRVKGLFRNIVYRLVYLTVSRGFFIGELNRQHYLTHGVRARKLQPSRYCVPDAFADMAGGEKLRRRDAMRRQLGLGAADFVVGFFGKLIPKKAPHLIVEAWHALPESLRQKTRLLFVGDGRLWAELEGMARTAGCPAQFVGFINQTALPDYYLAVDVVALPSQQNGETWGLVVNEALNAGCGVAISDAVGCGVEFAAQQRVRIVPVGSASALAAAFAELSAYPRDFEWARSAMQRYSIQAAAEGLAAAIPSR